VIFLTNDRNLIKNIFEFPTYVFQIDLSSATGAILIVVFIEPLINAILTKYLITEGAFFGLVNHQRAYGTLEIIMRLPIDIGSVVHNTFYL
jgi:hypothetical protein